MPDDLTLAWQRLRSSRETPTSGLHTTLNLAQSSRSPRRLRPTAPPEPAADLGDPRPRFPSSLAHLRVDLGPPRPTAQTVTSTSQNVEDQMLATIKERLAAVKAKEKSLEDQFDTLCTTHANLQRALQEAQDHEPQNDLKGGEEKVENEMLKKERQQADEEAASASAVQAEEESASASASQVENERLKRDLKKAQQQAEEESASASASQVENERLKRDLKKAQQQAEEEAEKKKKKLEEQLEDGKRQAKDKEVENEMLKKGLQKAQQQVGAVNVTLYITLKDQPAEMADTAPKKSYPGEFRENAARCVISFPGKYPSGWDALVKGHHDSSIGCVFFTTPGERGFGDLVDPGEGGLGDHVQDPEAEEGICYCKAIYGERSWEKFHYLKKVKKENLKEELEKAKVTKIHVVEEDLYNSSPEKKEEADKEAQQKYEENKRRAPWGCAWFPAWMKNGHKAVEQGQKLQVVFFAGQKGKGKVHWNDLPGSELWNGEGLGGSQKGEVAYLDKMWRETNNPAWIYEEIDVMQFLQGEFNLEQEVDARDMAKNWRRGHIVGLPVAGAADDKEWVPKWTVQCNKDLEKFESTFLMHTVEPIDKLLKEVGKDNLSRMLEQHLPKGVDLDVMFASRCRLENGHAAFAVNVRVPHVKAIHMLRDQVLCGDLEAELNRSLADIHQSEFQVQVDKTEFFEQYESSLLSLSKLTHHQESKLRQLHQRKSKELHLTAPAGAGKTFVAVQFALDKVYENCKSEGAILYVAPRLSLCLHFVQWLIARHLWLKGRGGELEELLSRIVIMHKRDEDYVNVKLVLEGNQFAEHPAAAPEYLLAIFDEAHELFTTDEMTGIYRDLRANQKLLLSDMSQSASLRVALPEVEDTVSLSDVVRSTQRIVAAAQAFELEKSKGITTSCSGTNGPPLKTFIFEALDDAEMFHQCCRYTLDAIRHVFRSYPSLSSLHLRVAIIVPDKTFCDKFKGLLRDELTSTFTARKFQLRSFAESLRYLRSHHHDERAAGDEVLVLDTVEEARGQEMMVVICVGLDQKIADTDARKTDTLLTRARIYQGITRAQLMAIVVDKLIQGGFLQFLTTLKFNNKKFDQSFAFSEGTSKAASRIKKKAEALPSEVVEEKDGEGMDTAAMTGLSLAVVKDELGGIEQLLEVCIVKENDDGANKFISADGKAQGEIDKDGPRDDDRFETSIWDTDSNQTKSTSQTLAFDPRIDQVLGRILEELPGGESTPGLEARKEIDHTDGKSQAGLARYFEQKYKQGGDFEDEEYERDVKDWCWVHKPSGIKVWQDAIDLSQSGGSGHCVFHYTTGLGFRNITNTSSKVAEVFASLITAGEKANALWGAGVYTVRKTPDEWPSIESLLDNMYRNMLRRDIELKGHEHAGEVTQLYASRVAYCIPIIADAAILYDVSVRPTPEMVEQGRPAGVNLAGKLLNEPGKPVRSVIVVRVENEEENYVSNAYANLLPTLRTRARAVAARLGTKHAEAHSAFGRLATVLGARGAFREAERLWRQILEAKELELGAEHADTLACANNLAGVFRAQQKVDEAEPLYRRALSGFEAMAGTMHPYALACANNLAILLKDQGKLDEAEVLHRQTLELCESQLGEAHLDTLYALNNLAVLLGVNGKLKEAEALSRRALGFRQSLLGEMHPETLISWSSLATVLQAQGNLGEAEPSHRRALEGRESQLGLQHPHTLASMYGLAQLLEANGSIDEADQLYLRELTITEEIYGPDHIATRVSRKNLERFRGQHSTG